mmetsp:Transcript_58336/g.162577  ORF Transcript_58336/g.162577 Transcript_58336/m.162577 type:complete len:213 (+) Transcript_58336:736-1374(+)
MAGPIERMCWSRSRHVPSSELFFSPGHSVSRSRRTLVFRTAISSLLCDGFGPSADVITSASSSAGRAPKPSPTSRPAMWIQAVIKKSFKSSMRSGRMLVLSRAVPMCKCTVPFGPVCSSGTKNISRLGAMAATTASGSYMLNVLTRSHMESESARPRPWPPQKVSQNHLLSHRGGSFPPVQTSFQRFSIDVRCARWSRQTTGFGAGQRTIRS